MGVLRILDGDAEECRRWSPDVAEEVEVARAEFEARRRQGFTACRVGQGGEGGGSLAGFDPGAEEIFMLRFVDGG